MRGINALVLAVCAIAAVCAQEIPRFKSGVDVVHFTVTVLDKERRPISGLTAADFDVLVDGKPKPLAAFAAVTLPGESRSSNAATIPAVAPDVHTNQLPAEGRLVVIVMDRSIPDGHAMQTAHAIANAAIDRLGPNDLGAVVYTGAASRKYSQGLTDDRARLHAAVNVMTFGAVVEPPSAPSLTDIGLSFQVARAKSATSVVTVRYALRDEIGQMVADVDVPRERAVASGPSVNDYDIGIRLPTAPGRYVAAIEVSDGRRTARREVPLTAR